MAPEHGRARESPGGVAAWVRDLSPGSCAQVMATGIVSTGLSVAGWAGVSAVLLGWGLVVFVVLALATVWRLVGFRRRVVADELNPSRSFAFFTIAAGANVLAARLALGGDLVAAAVLLVIGSVTWLLLGYALPLVLIGRHGLRPALAGADGTWFLWVVGAQSIVVAITAMPVSRLEPVAVLAWSVGVLLYLAVAVLVLGRLFAFPVRARQLTPSYWVFMGATAVCALAGTQLLHWSRSPLINAVGSIMAGLSVVLFGFGTWTIPALVAESLWRADWRSPWRYDPDLWSVVFPVAMYGVASYKLGAALGIGWLRGLGSVAIWAGAVLWVAVFATMIATAARAVRR